MAARRYWRLVNRFCSDSSRVLAAEIELRIAAGGADQTGSGTASASAQGVGEEASKAFDNNTGTYWQASTGSTGAWIQYDFGSGVTKDIVEVAMQPLSGFASRAMIEFDVQSSPDAATWATEWSVSAPGWTNAQRVFTKPTAANHRYWRLRPDSLGAGNTMSCGEMEMRSTAGGADQTGSGTASARTTFSTQTADKAFDNNASTFWSGNADAADSSWLAYDFGAGVTKDIQQISFSARNDGSFFDDQSPRAGWVESSADFINWISRWTFSGLGAWTNGQTKVFGAASASGRRRIITSW